MLRAVLHRRRNRCDAPGGQRDRGPRSSSDGWMEDGQRDCEGVEFLANGVFVKPAQGEEAKLKDERQGSGKDELLCRCLRLLCQPAPAEEFPEAEQMSRHYWLRQRHWGGRAWSYVD